MLVNVTIPVFNEEDRLPGSVPILYRFLAEHCRFSFEVVVADNGSTDRTLDVARTLLHEYPGLQVVHLGQKGRGRALKKVWSESHADVLSYMDVDLSTELSAFPPLIEALLAGGYDLAIGSRLMKHSLVTRGLRREVISRGYNFLIKMLFRTTFSDAQCGFKAMTRKAAERLLPLVEDNGWFMDTELLILAEKLGYQVFDLPVTWVENLDTRVKVWKTALEDLRGLARVRRSLARGLYEPGLRASVRSEGLKHCSASSLSASPAPHGDK